MGIFKKRPKPLKLESLEQLEVLAEDGKPVLVDFMQFGCGPCQIMDGIVNELAEEYVGSAHVVKANAAHVPDAFQAFKVRSTPTFVVLSVTDRAQQSGSKKVTLRWRQSGLVKKDQLQRTLESNGAVPVEV